MVMGTKTPQGARLNPQNTLELSQGMSIQTAIDTADAHGGFWVILLYPSTTYDEGDLTTTGGAIITLRGMDDHVMIAPAAAPATAVVNITETLYLENLLIVAPDATRPAVLINTAAGAPVITDCVLVGVGAGYSLQMTQGSVNIHRTGLSGDVHLSTARCLIDAYFSTFLGDLITAGALDHDIDLMSCNMTQGNIISNATGATVISCQGVDDIDAVTNAGTGLFTFQGSYVNSINCTNAAGEVRVRGGTLNSVTRAVGSVVWWEDDSTIKVLPSATITDGMIAHALAAAGAGNIAIRLPFGTFEEDSLVVPDNVQITGEGKNFQSHILINSANDIFTFGNVTAGLRRVEITQNGAGNCIAINNAGADVFLDESRISAQAAQDVVHMTAGSVTLRNCIVVRGDIDLSTADCTIEVRRCSIQNGDIVTAGAFNHNVTLLSVNMTNNNITNNATGATTIIIEKCINVGALTDASLLGTVTIESTIIVTATKTGSSPWTVRMAEFGTLSNTNAAGAITCYGGLTYALVRAVGPIVLWGNSNTLNVKPCTTITDTIIQWAVDAAAAGDTVFIHPGTYEEAVVLAAGINLKGTDKEACIINIDHAVLITMAAGCSICNLTLDVTCDATGSGTGIELNDAACNIEDVNIVLHRPAAGAWATGILESTGATARIIYIRNVRCAMSDDTNERGIAILQAGKTIYIENSWIQGSDYGVAIGISAGGAVASTIISTNSHFEATSASSRSVFCNGGTWRMNNDSIGQASHAGGRILRENNGVVTYKSGPRQYEVWFAMSPQDAIDAALLEDATPAASDPYTVSIHPGIYDERITMGFWVNLKGIGPAGSVVIYQDDVDVLVGADHIEVENLTLRMGTLSGGRQHIGDAGNALTITMRRVIFEVVVPAAHTVRVMSFDGAGTYTIIGCSHNIGGTGASLTIRNATGAGTFHLVDNDFTFTNANAFHIVSSQAGTWTGWGNRWAGTCGMFSVTAGTITLDNDAMICTADWTNTGSSIILRHCGIEAPIVAGNLARVILKECSYKAIQRAGTGNIVDESPSLKDAPWHTQRWSWMATLAQSQVTTRGTPEDAGTGQVLLEVTDNVVDTEAIESGAEAAGALSNKLTPARTPRYLVQIAVDSFDANVTMFFGLREVLGNAVPAATEDHAGLIWDGANFKASSDDGAATQATNLAEPSTGAQHQLEVVVFGGVTTVGLVEFWVDGVLAASHVTRIPVDALDWQHLLATAGAGGGDVVQVTVRNGGAQECPA